MTDKEIIREAYYALAGYRSPSLTKEKQERTKQKWFVSPGWIERVDDEKQDEL